MKVLWVPCLSLDLTLINRLADSVDWPVEFKVAVNNGPEGALESFGDSHPDWVVIEPAVGNLGCAGAWNLCAKTFPDEPTALLMNEDAFFLPGYLEQICKAADANTNASAIFLNESQAFYCFVATRAGREQFGTFDENFWPAYYEDCDMRVRHRLKGVRDYPYALQGLPPLPHGKPRTGGMNYSALQQGAGLLLRAYWNRKWGSFNYEEATYQTPYKDQRLTVKDWVYYPEHRAAIWPLWNAFMSMPNPSIYD